MAVFLEQAALLQTFRKTLERLGNYLFPFLAFSLVVYFLALRLVPGLTALSFGADLSLGLGHNVRQIQRRSLLLAFFAMGLMDCFFGVFSFMGLIFPHLLRKLPWFAYDVGKELRFGPLFCGLLFVGLDFLCYDTPLFGAEIPVGLLSTVVGSLFITVLLVLDLNRQPLQ